MSRPSRRQLLLAGAAVPLLSYLPQGRASAALDGVDVLSRAAWGGDLKPTGPLSQEAPGDVRFLLVHHTATSNSYASADVVGLLRGIYRYHTTSKGWPDIAYNFVVDRYGRVWEGRTGSIDAPMKGDATGGSQGFALLACFLGNHATEPPTAAAVDAMGRLLRSLATRYGIDVNPGATTTFTSRGSNRHPAGTVVTTATVAGHRDMSLTTCPGDACYRLIRTLVLTGNRLHVFGRGSDDALWHKSWNGSWGGWQSLGGVLTTEPAAVSWGGDRLDVFVRGTDNALWHTWRGGSWSGWAGLGGGLTSAPAVASRGLNRLDVFVRGTDNALWHRSWDGTWSGWTSLGGVLTSAPAAAARGSDRLDVFVRGTDEALWQRSWNGAWGPWESRGGRLASAPAAASPSPDRIDVLVRGTDDGLWHRSWAGGWSPWASLGGVLTSEPTASSWAPNRLDVFVRGTDSAIWHRWRDGGWSGWESLGQLP